MLDEGGEVKKGTEFDSEQWATMQYDRPIWPRFPGYGHIARELIAYLRRRDEERDERDRLAHPI